MNLGIALLVIAGILLVLYYYQPQLREKLAKAPESTSNVDDEPPFATSPSAPTPTSAAPALQLEVQGRTWPVRVGDAISGLPVDSDSSGDQPVWQSILPVTLIAQTTLCMLEGVLHNQIVQLGGTQLLIGSSGKFYLFTPLPLSESEVKIFNDERPSFVDGDDTILNLRGITWSKRAAFGENPDYDPGEATWSTFEFLDVAPDVLKGEIPSLLPLDRIQQGECTYTDLRLNNPQDDSLFALYFAREDESEVVAFIGRRLGEEELEALVTSNLGMV